MLKRLENNKVVTLKLFGITLYKRKKTDSNSYEKKFLNYFLTIYTDKNKKIIKLCGIVIYKRKKIGPYSYEKKFLNYFLIMHKDKNKKITKLCGIIIYSSENQKQLIKAIDETDLGKEINKDSFFDLNNIDKLFEKISIVSFDIFDTLLIRPFVEPTDIFGYIEEVYKEEGFKKARIKAEKASRIINKNKEEITLDDIYENITPEYKKYKEIELKTEFNLLKAHPINFKIYKKAMELNKKIIFVSDMYLPESFLEKVLKKNGYDVNNNLFVSSTYEKCKSGGLFDIVIRTLKVAPNKIIHIGDNEEADIISANKMKMKTLYVEKYMNVFFNKNKNKKIKSFYSNNKTIQSSLLCSLMAQYQYTNKNYWNELGYFYGGALANGYVQFIQKKAIKNKLDGLLFVSRDGFILREVYNKIFSEEDRLDNYYIKAPRILNLICFADYSNNEQYLKNLLMYFKKYINSISISDDYEKNKESLKKNKKHIELITNKNKKEYQDYISTLNITKNKLACVDMTTGAFSSLNFLKKFFENKILLGFYSGTFNEKSEIKYETFFEDNFNHNDLKLVILSELLITSTELPISGMEKGKFVYNECLEAKERSLVIGDIIEGILQFTDDYMKTFNNKINFDNKFIYELLDNYVSNISPEDSFHLKNVVHTEDPLNKENKKIVDIF